MAFQATNSGLLLLPLMAGLIISATLSGRYVTRTGKYKSMMIGGAGIQFIGIFLMSQLGSRRAAMGRDLAAVRARHRPWTVAEPVQHGLAERGPVRQIGVATSTSMFLRQCGGMIGVSIFGAMLLAKMSEPISQDPGHEDRPRRDAAHGADGRRTAARRGSPMMQSFVVKAISDAMSYIFMGSLVIVAIAFVAILFIPQITLRGRGPGQNLEKATESASPEGPITQEEPTGAVKAD